MHRVRLATLKFARHFTRLMAGVAPYAASASSALILWHAANDTPVSDLRSPAPLIYPSDAPLAAASATAAVTTPQSGAPAVQQASVSTLYGHMSRFAKNIRIGSHVEQGDIIGYVGMTGLATGPHLHYEYLMNGVHKNPQTVQLPGAEPLPADALIKFRTASAPWLAALSAPFTWQIGDPNTLAEMTGITVVGDFRRRDARLPACPRARAA